MKSKEFARGGGVRASKNNVQASENVTPKSNDPRFYPQKEQHKLTAIELLFRKGFIFV